MRSSRLWIAAAVLAACHERPALEQDEGELTTGSCGVERWAVKTGSDSSVGQVNMTAQDTTIAALRAIPAPSTLSSSSPRFTYAGSPEIQLYRLSNVTLTLYKMENDSDYHVVLQDSAGNTMITEIPYPGCVASASAWTSQINGARSAFDAKYAVTTSFQTANDTVTVTGVGFFDLLHGQTGVAPNGIELHSVLGICWGVNCSGSPPPPPPPGALTNGGFESGLTGWTSAGSTSVSAIAHGGSQSAMVGSTSPSTDSSLSQTFTLPANATGISFWYQVHCPDTITYDWASATLKDNTSGTSTTVLANTCSNTGAWQQASAAATGGHSVTLTLANHDDNYSGDPTYTLYDDVAVTTSGGGDTTPPTTSVTAPAPSSTVSGTVTVTATATDNVGVTRIELYADGALIGSGTSSPTSAAWDTTAVANGSHSLTSKAYDAAGNVGTSSAVTVTVNNGAVANPIVNPGFETGTLAGWTATGTARAATYPHSGSYAAALGATTPTTDSSITQTFTMPAGASTISFWYKVGCPDTVTYDWATATLKDNTTGTVVTLLPRTCTNTGAWQQASASTTSMRGHSVTLTLSNHDDNYTGDATWTDYDDVSVQ
ncbi:MAG: hypothetical protein E6J78_17225 [Deltaproteobacteria bacterium]|nr:MAG: hypothetical protein E6J78_17225 [Deltaproteobacteria bacterium]